MPTWDEDIRQIVQSLPQDDFSTSEMYTYVADLQSRHPSNNNVEAKIRQTIQNLARNGEVLLVDHNGAYRRLHPAATPRTTALATRDDHARKLVPELGTPDTVPLERRSAASYAVSRRESAIAYRREQDLVEAWDLELRSRSHRTSRWEIPTRSSSNLYSDLYDETDNVLYEAKGLATRESVRLAIGQLFDYRRYLRTRDPILAVLLPERPSDDMIELLEELDIGLIYREDGLFDGFGIA